MHGHGFERVTRLADARAALRDACTSHGRSERLPVAEAVDRVLSKPVAANRSVPHYDRAAMDGYAVRARDTHGASERSPTRLNAGDGGVAGEEAVPVHTGDALPTGADAVVMLEHVERRGDELTVYDAVAVGENVAAAGEDVEAEQPLFEGGHGLGPSDLALLRAAGLETVEAYERPQVSVVPTGDELVDAGTEPGPGETVETNGLLVTRLAERWGGDAAYRDVVDDDEPALRAAIEGDTDRDIVVTIGGSSVGDRDLVSDVVADAGKVVVHGVAIKPGHPVGFGIVDETPVLMLPGYPVSCLLTAVQFLRAALAWLTGATPRPLPSARARLVRKIPTDPGERTFARVRLTDDSRSRSVSEVGFDSTPEETLPRVEPVRIGGAGVMSSVAFADGWVEIPESSEGVPAEEIVSVQAWELPDVARPNRPG